MLPNKALQLSSASRVSKYRRTGSLRSPAALSVWRRPSWCNIAASALAAERRSVERRGHDLLMSRSKIVPPPPSKLPRSSWLLLVFALALGACSLALFDAGRSTLGIVAGIPALFAFFVALRDRFQPFVLHLR